MEDKSPESSYEEANKIIQTAFNSPFAIHQAKNIAIRKQMLEVAIQKLLDSKTFYINDVRDIAAMNNRPFDQRSKLYEQLNILNCREFRKMKIDVLRLLPLMIHRATGISEERFASIVEIAMPERALPVVETPAASAPVAASAPLSTVADRVTLEAVSTVTSAMKAQDAMPSNGPIIVGEQRRWSRRIGALPLYLSLGLNAVAIALLLPLHSAPSVTATGTSAAFVLNNTVQTTVPSADLQKMAATLPTSASGDQYVMTVRVERVVR